MPFNNSLNPITDIAEAQNAIDIVKRNASALRRQKMQKRIDYYYGIQEQYLIDLIKKQFQYPDRLKIQKEFYNCTAMIIDEVACIYNESPYRELKDATDKDRELYSEIIEKSQFDLVMETACKLSKLCKTVLIRPVWRNDQMEYDILTPNMFDVIQNVNNKTKADGIIYSSLIDISNEVNTNNDNKETDKDPFIDDQTVFYYFSKDKHFIITTQFSNKEGYKAVLNPIEGNEDNVNPYKVLPFVVIRDGFPVDDFFIEGGDDVVCTNEIVNIKLTEKNHLTKMQSFSLLVRKGAQSNSKDIILDPSMLIDIPGDDDTNKGTDIFYITPEAKIQELASDITEKLRMLAIRYKLNPDMFTASAQRSSAQSLQLQDAHLSKIIKRDKPYFRAYEKQIFELTKIIYNYHSNNKLSDACSLFVDFKDIEQTSTQKEKDEHNLLLYNNKLMSRTKWFMIENPDISDEQDAIIMLEKIDEEAEETEESDIVNGYMSKEEDKTNKIEEEDDVNIES